MAGQKLGFPDSGTCDWPIEIIGTIEPMQKVQEKSCQSCKKVTIFGENIRPGQFHPYTKYILVIQKNTFSKWNRIVLVLNIFCSVQTRLLWGATKSKSVLFCFSLVFNVNQVSWSGFSTNPSLNQTSFLVFLPAGPVSFIATHGQPLYIHLHALALAQAVLSCLSNKLCLSL